MYLKAAKNSTAKAKRENFRRRSLPSQIENYGDKNTFNQTFRMGSLDSESANYGKISTSMIIPDQILPQLPIMNIQGHEML